MTIDPALPDATHRLRGSDGCGVCAVVDAVDLRKASAGSLPSDAIHPVGVDCEYCSPRIFTFGYFSASCCLNALPRISAHDVPGAPRSMTTFPAPFNRSPMKSACIRPITSSSERTLVTTLSLSVMTLTLMTGMPAATAASTALTVPGPLIAARMIASTLLAMRSSTCEICLSRCSIAAGFEQRHLGAERLRLVDVAHRPARRSADSPGAEWRCQSGTASTALGGLAYSVTAALRPLGSTVRPRGAGATSCDGCDAAVRIPVIDAAASASSAPRLCPILHRFRLT